MRHAHRCRSSATWPSPCAGTACLRVTWGGMSAAGGDTHALRNDAASLASRVQSRACTPCQHAGALEGRGGRARSRTVVQLHQLLHAIARVVGPATAARRLIWWFCHRAAVIRTEPKLGEFARTVVPNCRLAAGRCDEGDQSASVSHKLEACNQRIRYWERRRRASVIESGFSAFEYAKPVKTWKFGINGGLIFPTGGSTAPPCPL